MKTLIVFYSFEGNTRYIAEIIARETDGDLEELKTPDQPKSHGFSKFFWGGKQVFMNEQPRLESLLADPEQYELIVIGTPVWVGTVTPAVKVFLQRVKFQDKKVAIFCCHGGGKGKTLEFMKEQLSDNMLVGEIDFKEPLKDNEFNVSQKVKEWLNDIDKLFK